MTIELVFTRTITERYTPCNNLDEITVAALRSSGFEYKYGSWYRSHTEFRMVDEESVASKAVGKLS